MTLFLAVLVTGFVLATAQTPNTNVADVSSFKKLRSWGESSLYQVEASTNYVNNPYLIHLIGTKYDMGYAYGHLLAEEIKENYHSLLYSLLGKDLEDKLLLETLGLALDWQWRDYLSIELPDQYKMELLGLEYGARDKGCSSCGQYIKRATVLANSPGDVKDFIYILLREFNASVLEQLSYKPLHTVEQPAGLQCSMFAVWGDRTANGQLFSGRNLDWNKDTGVNKYKMVIVNVPKDSSYPSVSITFAGLYGTIAGMSSMGLTVHEANLEENKISFSGFPWTLRLRYIMENAKNIDEAKSLWEATNNTVGFNHMVASGPDAAEYNPTNHSTVALAMETMYGYTAYFPDNDPREAAAVYPQTSSGQHIGFPLKEAVWRTNHGYDPVIRQHYEWSQSPSSWSMQRYMFMHDAFVYYDSTKAKIDYTEAINVTSIAGDKGKHAYSCEDNTDGTNVISVTFQPQQSTLYAAWESSTGSTWRPGVCSTYIKLDMKDWFQGKSPASH